MRIFHRGARVPAFLALGLLFSTVFTLGVAADEEVIPVSIELQPEEVTVGDRVKATLKLVLSGEEPASTPRFPAWGESWGQAEILEIGEVESFTSQSGYHVYQQELLLTAFQPGEITLPVMTVAVPMEEETIQVPTRDAVRFMVTSVLPPEPEEGADPAAPGAPGAADPANPDATNPDAAGEGGIEPKGNAGYESLPADARFWWTAAVMVVLCVLAARALAQRLEAVGESFGGPGRKRRILAPLEELMEGLDAINIDAAEPAHTGMSASLRHFLSRSLGFNASESTTSEIQRRLRDTQASSVQAQRAVKLLRECDGVKFAREDVTKAVTMERIERVRLLGRELDEALRPPEPAEDTEGNQEVAA